MSRYCRLWHRWSKWEKPGVFNGNTWIQFKHCYRCEKHKKHYV